MFRFNGSYYMLSSDPLYTQSVKVASSRAFDLHGATYILHANLNLIAGAYQAYSGKTRAPKSRTVR